MKENAYKIGFWSALLAFLGATAYSIAQIVSPPMLPILTYPVSEIAIIAPSIVIPLALVIAMNCLNFTAPEEKKIWSQIALTFAVMYAVFVSFVYIIQLGTVIPFTIKGEAEIVAVVALSKAHWIQAVDGFGYSLMSVSFLFASFVFAGTGAEAKVRKAFVAHGLLAPFIILPLWFPPAIVIGTLWFITGPLALFLLASFFKGKTSLSEVSLPAKVAQSAL
jgi:hypothetical protein